MKIVVQYREILEVMPLVDGMLKREFKAPATPVKLAMLHRILATRFEEIEAQRMKIVQEEAQKDEEGNTIYLDEEKKLIQSSEQMARRLTELFKTEDDTLDIPIITPVELEVAGGKPFTGAALYPLVPFLKME